MGWPCNTANSTTTMEFSVPTTASHPLEAALTQPEEDQEARDSKRRKLQSSSTLTEGNVAMMMMMDTTTMPTAVSLSSSAVSSATCTDETSMNVDEIECHSTTTSTTATTTQTKTAPHHPSSCNAFNGNALSDEELVYQVLESGCQTYAEVVQFCVARGIPISRILQMDLVRRLSYLRAG